MAARLLGLYDESIRLRWLIEFSRYTTFSLIVCLLAGEREDDPDSWVTIGKLQRVLPSLGIPGGRNITELVSKMQNDGLLRSVRAPHDGRVRLLRPTQQMIALDRQFMPVTHAPLHRLFPEEGYDAALRGDAVYHHAFRRASLQSLGVVQRVMSANPGADFFIQKTVGTRVLMLLYMETAEAADGATQPGFLTRAAERSMVSRTHVSNLISAAAEAGFVQTSGSRKDTVIMSPALRQDTEMWIADSLSATSITHRLALEIAAAEGPALAMPPWDGCSE
ncbi:hypothetical protein [Alteriqipengyuania lutimaris]|uniref:Uncharacterized protein n=1 Tax=Alteriqipengyuania lutimaris TaxID=1538146 RepID=A0A395LNZ4_9SPHN|nr:hypothetical protein [Alteriqipengyuania lutimaris]MBB3032407.1 DNA-binding MarR family transcriptional regulator [Alteriqipengyuania lutimaris]RDS78445.1 hypothetical protein DL238_13155 [Alteriqipengyuania lutimaris]